MKRLSFFLLPLLLNACAMLPSEQNNIYDLRREAQIAYTGEQDERAEKLLLGLSRAAPNDAETWFYLGNLYARTNRPEQATQAYQKALMLKGSDAKAWHNIGVVRVREAWAAFIQAYSLAPVNDPMHAKLEALISAMEKIPLEGLTRNAPAASAQPSAMPASPAAAAK
ncbi:MAG: tetratricopeptide repeat protein [Proteobacteria bacterium]|nr:tetratricopeptide repeat protein [Pseudomonadota bacterium]